MKGDCMSDQEAEAMVSTDDVQTYVTGLTKGQAAGILHIDSCGERGWWIHGGGANWVTVALLEKNEPGRLFTGVTAEHVKLTAFGKLVADAIRANDQAEGLEQVSDRPKSPSRPSRDETWLQVAEAIAQRGTCPRRQVACVIVDTHGRVMATGYNGPASGRPHCSEGEPCPGAHFQSGEGLDKCEAIHAEQNACLLLSDPWKVDTVYITASPCLSCVKLLLGTSAKRIVCREIYPHQDAIDWWHRAGRELIQLPKEQLQLRA